MKRRLRLAAALALLGIATGVFIAGSVLVVVGKVSTQLTLGVAAGLALAACVVYGREQLRAYRYELAADTVRDLVADENPEEVEELLRAFETPRPRICPASLTQPTNRPDPGM